MGDMTHAEVIDKVRTINQSDDDRRAVYKHQEKKGNSARDRIRYHGGFVDFRISDIIEGTEFVVGKLGDGYIELYRC